MTATETVVPLAQCSRCCHVELFGDDLFCQMFGEQVIETDARDCQAFELRAGA